MSAVKVQGSDGHSRLSPTAKGSAIVPSPSLPWNGDSVGAAWFLHHMEEKHEAEPQVLPLVFVSFLFLWHKGQIQLGVWLPAEVRAI